MQSHQDAARVPGLRGRGAAGDCDAAGVGRVPAAALRLGGAASCPRVGRLDGRGRLSGSSRLSDSRPAGRGMKG
jgi:hypothetical protein